MRSGFTLLETLIALVIAALLTLVLLDSLTSATGHAARISQSDKAHNGRVLALIPVLRALQGAIPEYHDGEGLFVGEATNLRGLTLSGLGKGGGGVSGAPVLFAITIEDDELGTWLNYLEEDQMLARIALPEGAFIVYQDVSGEAHSVWPPHGGLETDPLYYRPVPGAVVFRAGEIDILSVAPARDAGLTLRAVDFDLVL